MKKLLDPEGKLFTAIGVAGDHLLMSVLWLICLLPVITVGAASAAMCQVSLRILRGDGGSLLKDFFGAFRQHFKKATALWLLVLAVGLLILLDGWFYLQVATVNPSMAVVVLGMLGMIFLLFAACLIWMCPSLCLYGGSFRQALKMCFVLGLSRIGWTVLMLVVDAGLAVGSLFAPFLIPFVPGLITLFNTLCIRFALGKHIRKEEAGTEE